MTDLEITIQRPNGQTEYVIKPGMTMINTATQQAMTIATRNAGRGEILSFREVKAEYHKSVGCPHYTRDQGCPLHGETCH